MIEYILIGIIGAAFGMALGFRIGIGVGRRGESHNGARVSETPDSDPRDSG